MPTLLNQNLSTCYILLEIGDRHIPLQGSIIGISESGLWIAYKYDGKEYNFVHGLSTERKEKTKEHRPHFLLPFGSMADVDWVTGEPTANMSVISALTKSKIAVDAIKAIARPKGGLNWKILLAAAIGVALIIVVYVNFFNKDKTKPETTTTPPITNIIPKK